MSTGVISPRRESHRSSGALRRTWQRVVDAQKFEEAMVWTAFVRRAREKPRALYCRSVPGAFSERFQVAPVPRAVMPIPLQCLLECEPDFIYEAGAKALEWLEKQEDNHRELFLRRLARVLEDEMKLTHPVSPNVIATIELLARYHVPQTLSLLNSELQERPVCENHLYLVSLCPDLVSSGNGQAGASAELVESVLDAQAQLGLDASVEWQTRLVVESFRVLAYLEPKRAVGPICRWIPSFGEMETTAVLEEVTKAARHQNVVVSPELHSAIDELWDRYMHNPALTNAPGVLAKLLELMGRSGKTTNRLVELAKTCPSPTQVLYLLAMRRPPFLGREGKLTLYGEAIKQLVGSDHRMALQQVLEAVMKDSELQAKDFLGMISQVA